MKKTGIAIVTAVFFTLMLLSSSASACPAWECQYGLDDYSCGGYHGGCSGSYNCGYDSYNYNSGSYNGYESSYNYDDCYGDSYSYSSGYGESCNYYDENSTYNQPQYCPYCGNESWACVCGTYTESNYDCNYNSDYSCGGQNMSHWANIRDCFGNVIGQAGCGDSIEVCGADSSDPDRVLIYDYSTGTYGSVLSSCVYGGYQWDGTGDNGYYNSYRGDCGYEDYGDYSVCSGGYSYGSGGYEAGYSYVNDNDGCGYYDDCGYSYGGYGVGCNAYSQSYYMTYCETVVQRCVTYGFTGLGGFGCI